MKVKYCECHQNNSNINIKTGEVFCRGKQIIGVALQDIPKGCFGWIQVTGPSKIKVKDWYDKNDLDSILGVK